MHAQPDKLAADPQNHSNPWHSSLNLSLTVPNLRESLEHCPSCVAVDIRTLRPLPPCFGQWYEGWPYARVGCMLRGQYPGISHHPDGRDGTGSRDAVLVTIPLL